MTTLKWWGISGIEESRREKEKEKEKEREREIENNEDGKKAKN